jgi:hypothetical protein
MPSTARWHFNLAVGLALIAAGSGCTTLPMGSAASAPRTDADEGDETAPRMTSRAKKKVPRVTAAGGQAPARARKAKGSSTVEHDPATSALIDHELADATIEEREDLLRRFRYLPDPSVRHILSERRKGLRLVGGQLAAAPPRHETIAPTPQSAAVVPAHGESSFDGAPSPARRRNSLNGLGTISAWGHAAPPSGETAALAGSPDAADDQRAANYSAEGQTAAASEDASPPVSEDNSPPPGAHPVAFGQIQADQSRLPGQSAAHRSHPPERKPDPAPVTPAVKPAAPAANGSGVPILGYLLPGKRFRAVAPAKTAAAPAVSAGVTASVAVGVPREAALETELPAGEPQGQEQRTPRELVEALIAITEPEVARLTPGEDESEKQSYIEQHVYLRMLYLIAGQQERALQAIPGIDPADQEFWQQTFWGLTNYFDVNSMPSSADRAAETVSQLTKAVLRLQEKANLDLRNVNFCHKIISFGNYEKYPRDEFRPGQEVLLYAEVANIHSEPAADGRFRTSLKSTLEIYQYGTEGELIEQIELPETIDVCRTHRRDYFHSYQFTIPPRLTLGPHILKLTVEDQLSRRSTSYSLNFMVK